MSQVETCILQLCVMTHFISLVRIFVSSPSIIHTPDPASNAVTQRSLSRKHVRHVVSTSVDTFVGTGETLQDKQNRTL